MAAPAPTRDIPGELKRGQIDPIYCLYGKERYLLSRALEALRAAVLEPATKDFNSDLIDAKGSSGGAIVAAARTLPMMARRRLVVVRGIDALPAAAHEELIAYLGSPVPEAVLVLLADKVDARQKLFAALKKRGALVAFEPPKERELPSFITAEARARGGSIEPPAARLLGECIGAELGALAQAIERLLLYAGARPVTEEDVSLCVADTRARSVFELIRALGEGKADRALGLLRKMLDDRESPLGIHAMLTRHFRQLSITRELVDRRAGKQEIAEALGLNPYFVDGLMAEARRLSPAALRRAFELLYQSEKALKSSRLDDGILLERLLMSLLAGAHVKRG